MKQATEGINGPFENNKVKIEGGWFKDIISHRTVGFRGINLGGNSKLPVNWTTSNGIDAYDIDNLSFIGKPLPLAEAEEHCLRLRYWGFNFLRLLVPWESIEHQGPGKYDENQMNYIIKLLFLFKKFGLKCLIDPHQDTWSRLCGGSGMPNWTLYLAGLDPRKFKQTISAVTMFEHDPPLEYPIMTWPTNYGRLATATMFTLFFAGEKLAPKCTIYDEKLNQLVNIQTYLQDKYCLAYQYLFSKIYKEGLLNSVVLGIDTLNEPSEGFIETEDITKLPLISMTSTRNGPTPTVLESFLLGEGNSVEVAKYSLSTFGFVKEGTVRVDPKGENVWLKEGESILPNLFFPPWQPWQKEGQCIWHMHGVWDRGTKKALLPNYFSIDPINGNKYNYLKDFWKPFVRKITSYVRTIQPDIIIFIEPPVNAVPPKFTKEEGDPIENIVYSPHWYDGKTLVTLKFDWWTFDYLGFIRGKYWFIGQALKLGRKDVRKCFEEMIEMIANEGKLAFPNAPLLIGECGIPFNMINSNAFKNGDYKEQIDALDATLNATEQIGGMCTLWNYCIDNNHLEGDLWNREDLSIYSKD
ncbi:glycoside hydrolase, partial [Neoconidiobolus thromboides FSU 785]